ncbi:MAG: hypothetical protein RLW62_11795 [Gammaproteobacteria bacterium]
MNAPTDPPETATPGDPASPFHLGEQRVQQRLGVRESIEPWARRVIQPTLNAQHRDFYRLLPFVVVAARDDAGRPWATLLAAAPGFMQAPDPGQLDIAAAPLAGDALAGALVAGRPLGVLGIDLETRRRNRVNGTLVDVADGRLRLAVAQAFGNCPQHIHPRGWRSVPTRPGTPRRDTRLSAR